MCPIWRYPSCILGRCTLRTLNIGNQIGLSHEIRRLLSGIPVARQANKRWNRHLPIFGNSVCQLWAVAQQRLSMVIILYSFICYRDSSAQYVNSNSMLMVVNSSRYSLGEAAIINIYSEYLISKAGHLVPYSMGVAPYAFSLKYKHRTAGDLPFPTLFLVLGLRL